MIEALLDILDALNCNSKTPSWVPTRQTSISRNPARYSFGRFTSHRYRRKWTQKVLSEKLLALDGTKNEKITPLHACEYASNYYFCLTKNIITSYVNYQK